MQRIRRLPTCAAVILASPLVTSDDEMAGFPMCGVPIVHFTVQASLDAGCSEILVVMSKDDVGVATARHLSHAFDTRRVRPIHAETALDATTALSEALAAVDGRILVADARLALITSEALQAIVAALDDAQGAPPALSIALSVPPLAARELKDGPPSEAARRPRSKRPNQVSEGVYAARAAVMREVLQQVAPADIPAFVKRAGSPTAAVPLPSNVLRAVRDCEQLVQAERVMHRRIARRWRRAGALVREGAVIDAQVTIEVGATVERGAVLRGRTRVGAGAVVDVGCVLTNVDIASGARLKPYSVAVDSRIGPRAEVGPFAHIRPDTDLGEDSRIGTFVETKNTKLGRGAMANHLAFLGDSVVGAGANVSAGTIFCNSDGFSKHATTVGDGAFIGSGCQLVAPVTIGAAAYVATGTTVTEDVPPNALAIGRVRQQNKDGYASTLRTRFRAAAPRKKGD